MIGEILRGQTPPTLHVPPEPHNLSPAAAASTPRIIIVIIISFCR
jgi:hypothetical protein